MIEIKYAGDTGTIASTSGTSTTAYTDWTKLETLTSYGAKVESMTAANLIAGRELIGGSNGDTSAKVVDGKIGCSNQFVFNMDGNRANVTNFNKVSYYVSVVPRVGSDVFDKGAYTVRFQLTDANGAVVGSSTVNIDFVTSAAVSDATLTLTTSGNFLKSAALATTDTAGSTYAYVQLKNRAGGLVRTNIGQAPTLSSKIEISTTAAPVYTETQSLTASDTGTSGSDFGTEGTG